MRPAVGGPIVGASLASMSVAVGKWGDVGDKYGDEACCASQRFSRFCHSAMY